MTHTEAVKCAIQAVISCGGRAWRRDVGLFYDARGHPRRIGVPGEADVQGILPDGRALAVEVKTGNAKRTREQIAWSKMWVGMGGVYALARYSATGSQNGDDVIKRAIKQCNP